MKNFFYIKNISKQIIMTCIAAAMVLSLCACHGDRSVSSFEVPNSFDMDKEYEITFWAKNDTNKNQTAVYEKAIEDFEKLYPNITVNIRLYTDYGKIYNDVITNISTGTTPNVCITYPDHIATYITGENVVASLDELITDEKYGLGGSEVLFDSVNYDDMIDKFLEECTINGQLYAIPFMRSTEVCYVNKTYVEKLGFTIPDELTWDFIWEVSNAALQKDSSGNYIVNGQNIMIPFIYKSTDNMMIQYLAQAGADYTDEFGNIGLFNDVTKNFLFDISEYTKNGEFSTFKISGYPANFLNAGQCIFAIDSTAGSTWMGADAPLVDISEESITDFETVVMEIPQLDSSNKKMISQGPSICIFNKEDSGEVLASWLFAQFLLTDEVQTSYAMTEGYIPVTTSAGESEEFLNYLANEGADNDTYYKVKIEAQKLLLENIDNTFTTSVFNGSTSVRDAAGYLIESVVKSTRRKETIDDSYIEDLYSSTISLYRLDSIETDASSYKDLGELPTESKILIASIICIWIIIIFYKIHNRKKEQMWT